MAFICMNIVTIGGGFIHVIYVAIFYEISREVKTMWIIRETNN